MAYDESLALRVRGVLGADPDVTEKRMFGGVAFLHRGRMVVGVTGDALLARVGKTLQADSLARPHVREMDFTGRAMAGFVFVDPAGIRTAKALDFWVQRARSFALTQPEKDARPTAKTAGTRQAGTKRAGATTAVAARKPSR